MKASTVKLCLPLPQLPAFKYNIHQMVFHGVGLGEYVMGILVACSTGNFNTKRVLELTAICLYMIEQNYHEYGIDDEESRRFQFICENFENFHSAIFETTVLLGMSFSSTDIPLSVRKAIDVDECTIIDDDYLLLMFTYEEGDLKIPEHSDVAEIISDLKREALLDFPKHPTL